MGKHKDLRVWLDYFDMLQTYENKGFLEMHSDKYEAYITEPALFTLSPDNLLAGIPDTLRRIRTYAAWIMQEGISYMNSPFALHVVSEKPPHDMLYTILLSRHRSWWCPWKREGVEIIKYNDRAQ